MSAITGEKIAAYVAKRRESKHAVSTINRHLEVLRRVLRLAADWGKVDKLLPRVEMLPGEKHRDRVLTPAEQSRYLAAAQQVGDGILDAHERALKETGATQRGEMPIKPEDPCLLRDVTTLLIDTGMRPDECYSLRWTNMRDGAIHVPFGKTAKARRVIPITKRVAAILEMRKAAAKNEWIFPAPTASGHIEKSTLRKPYRRACKLAEVIRFTMYDLRHTCLTRWAAHMDPCVPGGPQRFLNHQALRASPSGRRTRRVRTGTNSGREHRGCARGVGSTIPTPRAKRRLRM